MKKGRVLKTFLGLVSEVAAPKSAMTVAMMKPSCMADDKRSCVTEPPSLIPGIHDGRSIIGKVNRFVPGMGTPTSIPTMVRIAIMIAPILMEMRKLLLHGDSSYRMATRAAALNKAAPATHPLWVSTTAEAVSSAQAHSVSGWRDLFT